MYQVDLVPTTALVLGLPIPFSNLGMLIPEVLLPFSNGSKNDEPGDDSFSGRVTLDFLMALRTNVEQIRNYLVTYAQYSQDFPGETFQKLEKDFDRVSRIHWNFLEAASEGISQDVMSKVAREYFSYMREVKVMCQSVWAKFDVTPMVVGLSLLILAVLATPLMLLDVDQSSALLSASIPVGVACGVVGTMLLTLLAGIEVSIFGLFALVGNFALLSLSVTIFVFIWNLRHVIYLYVSSFRRDFLHRLEFQCLLAVAVVLLHALSMLSNSFILYEADMLAFFTQSLVCCFAVKTLRKELSGTPGKGSGSSVLCSVIPHLALMGCVRLSKLFYACRDLQIQDGCEATSFILPLASAVEFLGPIFATLRFLVSALTHYLVCVSVMVYLRRNQYYQCLNPLLAKGCEVGLLLSMFYVTGHWYTRYYTHTPLAFPVWIHVAFPRAVYAISGTVITLCVALPFRNSPRRLSCEDPSLDSSMEFGSHLTTPSGETVHPNSELNQGVAVRGLVAMATAVLLSALWSPAVMVLNDGVALSAALSVMEMVLALRILQQSGEGMVLLLLLLAACRGPGLTHLVISCPDKLEQ